MAEDGDNESIISVDNISPCSSNMVKWLSVDKIYQKLIRPNYYTLGKTNANDVLYCSILCKTEQVGTIFLLHLLLDVVNENSISVSVSNDSGTRIDQKKNIVYLSKYMKKFNLNINSSLTYVNTYKFDELDLKIFVDRKLYIPIKFHMSNEDTEPPVPYNFDFRELLIDPVGADFTIESLEGDSFHVHKMILSQHSKFFETMFKDMYENAFVNSDSIKPNINSEDLKSFLEFMYTGTILEPIKCNGLVLLRLADEYEINSLKDYSEIMLISQLSVDNALSLFSWADVYNSDALKIAAMKFIKSQPEIIQSPDFREIKNLALVHELACYVTS